MGPAGVTGVLRMIEDHQGDHLPLFCSPKSYPGRFFTPHLRFSFITLTVAVATVDSFIVDGGFIGRERCGIEPFDRFLVRLFKSPVDSDGEEALLVASECNLLKGG